MWFDELMDDFKNALLISSKNKRIFAPVFIKLGLAILFFIFCIVEFVFAIIGLSNMNEGMLWQEVVHKLPMLIGFGLLTYLLYLAGSSFLEAGSISLYKTASDDINPGSADFFGGVKKYFFKMFGGLLLINIIVIILSPILLLLYLIFALIVGTLTAGWGIVWLSVVMLVYFKAWTTIVVMDDKSPVSAILASIRFGGKYFWTIFVLMLSYLLITKYAIIAFGLLPALAAGWFFAGITTTYFRMVLLLIYKRKKEELI